MYEPEAIVKRVVALLSRIVFLDKRNMIHDGELRLYPSEIHTILMLVQDPEANATQLAERLSVTKGAVSQTLTRLQQKGVIETEKIPGTKNESRITFTQKGRHVVNQHVEHIHSTHAKLEAYLAALPECDRKAIDSFLGAIEDVIE